RPTTLPHASSREPRERRPVGRFHMVLQVSLQEASGVTVVHLSGRLTMGEGSARLRDEMCRMIASGKKRIVLNLAGMAELDSAGIGLLVGLYATASRSGGQLKLSNLSKRVKDLLVLTKLYSVFEVFDEQADALASFAAAAR